MLCDGYYKDELLDKYFNDVKRDAAANKQLNVNMGYTKVHQNKNM